MRLFPVFLFALAAGVLLLGGCTKDVSVRPGPYVPTVSIECILVPDSLPKLYLSRSQSFLGSDVNSLRDAIADAQVVITEAGGWTDTLRPGAHFNFNTCLTEYFYRGHHPIRTGQDYTLHLVADGQTFTAVTTTRLTAVPIGSVEYVTAFTDVYGEHEGIKVDYTDAPGERNYYRFSLVRTLTRSRPRFEGDTNRYCARGPFLDEEIGRSVYNDQNADGQSSYLIIEPANKHAAGETGTIRLQTLTPEAARFFDQLDRQKLALINPFVEPVFLTTEIPGAIGVFGAVNQSPPVPFTFPE